MSSQTFPRAGASNARRPPWPQPAYTPEQGVVESSAPFVAQNPRRKRRRRISLPVSARARSAPPTLSPAAPPSPRVRRRLKPGGLYRWVRRFRVPLAILLGICAALAALLVREHAGAETTTAIRATSDLAAGQVLSRAMLEEVEIDAMAVPQGDSPELEVLLGETMAVALPAGALVHQTQIVGPGLLAGYGAGTVAVPVRPSDTAIIGLLSPGQRVDVTASSDSPESATGPRRVAEAVPVLWVPQEGSENWLGAASEARDAVILAVDAATAEQIAEASHSGRLYLSLVGPAG